MLVCEIRASHCRTEMSLAEGYSAVRCERTVLISWSSESDDTLSQSLPRTDDLFLVAMQIIERFAHAASCSPLYFLLFSPTETWP